MKPKKKEEKKEEIKEEKVEKKEEKKEVKVETTEEKVGFILYVSGFCDGHSYIFKFQIWFTLSTVDSDGR